MKRINPTEIPALYDKLGLKPRTARIGDKGTDTTCLVGLLSVELEGFDNRYDDSGQAMCVLVRNGYTTGYVGGLFAGFDRGVAAKPREGEDPQHFAGVEDGVAASSACAEKGMLVSDA